jgi:hypothetical protein
VQEIVQRLFLDGTLDAGQLFQTLLGQGGAVLLEEGRQVGCWAGSGRASSKTARGSRQRFSAGMALSSGASQEKGRDSVRNRRPAEPGQGRFGSVIRGLRSKGGAVCSLSRLLHPRIRSIYNQGPRMTAVPNSDDSFSPEGAAMEQTLKLRLSTHPKPKGEACNGA